VGTLRSVCRLEFATSLKGQSLALAQLVVRQPKTQRLVCGAEANTHREAERRLCGGGEKGGKKRPLIIITHREQRTERERES